ncbi:hypothetical protein [Lutispora saccharofermentans]|uniref:Uncharacterized protein n=1 Tax=Lutispora saccharofermentans TaxID=3024236 RepID=A0ABT1NAN8_9FIRM|nr:hypothetical protein [Lutispora saccharofermentans]MCQ1528317.1 hypothetical protein [Lutispora saccharofermentans]
MPYRFATGDIKKIASRLGLQKVRDKVWSGTDIKGQFLQTYIHDHGDGVQIKTGTAKRQAEQMGFSDLEDMYDFLKNNRRKR